MEATNYSSYELPAETVYDGGDSGGAKAKQHGKNNKIGEGLARTKAAASTGVKKVKEGTSTAIHWIKDKCHHNHKQPTITLH
ncbi:hypothetical protein Vadar_001703 [Vaccinium darrowii]|uniref:Uncharacterized protein n=1 Tax=Vaccinium darrowii TaxID=229202 RepID=A0ACB7ZHJ8_9ERIC|nr:hypothetical protein Vadar_001703 [Vaccinium darrowii]